MRLVAFTCGGRGFCPTCTGRRMNQTTTNLLRFVLPPQPLRQWVLTLPFELRAPVAYQPGLIRAVARVFADSLLRWYACRLAPPSLPAQGGLFTVIQRCSGDLRLGTLNLGSPFSEPGAACRTALNLASYATWRCGRR